MKRRQFLQWTGGLTALFLVGCGNETEEMVIVPGGSFLCSDQYCTRYMVGTRGKGEVASGANHVGFRCAK